MLLKINENKNNYLYINHNSINANCDVISNLQELL